MHDIPAARAAVLDDVRPLGFENVDLASAMGRALAAPVVSTCAVPPSDNSAMDGVAVRWEDMRDATPETPVRLRVLGTIGAGQNAGLTVTAGCAVKIMTGATIPPGADAVVPVEDVAYEGVHAVLRSPAALGDHIRPAGADVKTGQAVFNAGEEVTSAHIGVLASIGVTRVSVGRLPRVTIIATGSELVDAAETPGLGMIRNSNGPALVAAIRAAGGDPTVGGIVRDDRDALGQALEQALDEAHVVVTSGGVSVGEFDFVKDVLEDLGVELRFHKVAQKPGKPLSYGRRGATHVFGVPGNPAAAMVCFAIYIRPLLRRLQGFRVIDSPMAWGRFEGRMKARDRTVFARVIAEATPEGYVIRSAGSQSSGLLLPMAVGRHLAVFEARERPYETGDVVPFYFLDGGVG